MTADEVADFGFTPLRPRKVGNLQAVVQPDHRDDDRHVLPALPVPEPPLDLSMDSPRMNHPAQLARSYAAVGVELIDEGENM